MEAEMPEKESLCCGWQSQGTNSIIDRAEFMCRTLCVRDRIQMKYFSSVWCLRWTEQMCWSVLGITGTWVSLSYAQGCLMALGFDTFPRNWQAQRTQVWICFLLFFFPSCKAQHFTKRKTLQRQCFPCIYFRALFKIHIHLPYPITGSKLKHWPTLEV